MCQINHECGKILLISLLMAVLVASSFSLLNYNMSALAQQSTNPASSPTAATDTVPPDTQITSAIDGAGKPVQNGVTTSSNSITFTFRGIDNSGSGVSNFQCSFDNRPYSRCGSQINLPGLTVGEHGFAAVAIDSAGNIDHSPATFVWTVQPQQSSAPSSPSLSTPPGTTSDTTPTPKQEARSSDTTPTPKQEARSSVSIQKPASIAAAAAPCNVDFCIIQGTPTTIEIQCFSIPFVPGAVLRCDSINHPVGTHWDNKQIGNPAIGILDWPNPRPPGLYSVSFQAVFVFCPVSRCTDSPVLHQQILVIDPTKKTTDQIYQESLQDALKRSDHYFRNNLHNHGLDQLVAEYGGGAAGEQKLLEELVMDVVTDPRLPTQGAIKDLNYVLKDTTVIVRGTVIDSVPKISTIFVPP